MFLQRTIRQRARVNGIGLHSGKQCSLTFCPAPENTGVVFVRADLPGRPELLVHADYVVSTENATTLGNEHFAVSTVEHCLSAMSALRVDNLIIELDGPEIPIIDGSSRPYLEALLSVGLVDQEHARQYAFVREKIVFGTSERYAKVEPYNGLRINCTIQFDHPAIGEQRLDIDINPVTFAEQLAGARTFGFLKDVEALHRKGLAQGGSLSNAVVLDGKGVMNSEGLRYPDEFVRHKILDALGDLVTLGRPLMGHLTLFRAGHDTTNGLIQKILENEGHCQKMELGTELELDRALMG